MNKFFRLILIFSVLNTIYAEEEFSTLTWKRVSYIYDEVLNHPFNQELQDGTLSKDKFEFYKAQDSYYLNTFSKVLTVLATKMNDSEDIRMVLKLSSNSLDEKMLNGKISSKEISPSTFAYTCLLYTSPSPRDRTRSRMPSSA